MRSPALLQTEKTAAVTTAPLWKDASEPFAKIKSSSQSPDGLSPGVNHSFGKIKVHSGGPRPAYPVQVQAKLAINQPNDVYEQEADAMAEQVMRMADAESMPPPAFKPVASGLHRKGIHGEEEEKQSQRKNKSGAETVAGPGLESYIGNLPAGGQTLSGEARRFFEPRFGYDFSYVKVHTDSLAAKSAQSINALAYTSGNNIVFSSGQYAPHTAGGKRLLGHELTHVVQQNKNIQPKKIQRATVTVNNQPVTIDFGNIISETNFLTGIQAQIATFTGSAPLPGVISNLTALSPASQRWLLFALDILIDNTTAAHAALNRTDAVNRLISFAPSATTQPLGGNVQSGGMFAREVLIQSGWVEVALTENLSAPGAASRAIIQDIVNPPATGGVAPGPLDVAVLNARLVPALKALLTNIDPALITNVGRVANADIQAVGDLILAEARVFFSPFSDASSGNVFNLNPSWVASANISDTTTIVSDRDRRLNYLANRAQIVGRNATVTSKIPDANIFADANFDGTRATDQAELFSIISTLEADPTVQPIVDRLNQHTGFQTGSGISTHIGINPEFNADTTTECEARWGIIDTMCHEVLHALVHPNFRAAASRVSFSQVVREGFTEVLGNQLFNDHVIPKAAADAAFKASLENGIAGGPCPAPSAGTIGYGSAGSGAEVIRTRVGNTKFRAAYFLGRADLVSI